MAKPNSTINAQVFQDRRVQLALAVAAVLIVAAIVFLLVGRGGSPDTTATTTPATPGASFDPGAAGDPAAAGDPMASAGYSSMGGATGMAPSMGASAAGTSAAGVPRKVVTSFDDAPGRLAGAAGAPSPGAPAGAADAGVAGIGKPKGVVEGRRAAAARPDPFVSKWIPRVRFTPPPASLFVLPIRLAAAPKPPVRIRDESGRTIALTPLPYVPRRVAGILTNGSVSAILETGNPGLDADVRVVTPGERVPSGITGIADLTVESITSSQVTLRAPDRRTVVVKLSNLPPGSVQQGPGQGGYPAIGVGAGAGGYPGDSGGYPGGGAPEE